MKYWLMKSEPDAYSIEDFKKEKACLWDGIRNYQARNFMIKEMSPGDSFLFYHSNCKPPAIVGLGEISKQAAPDPTAQDPKSKYYDPKSTAERPIWECVQVKYKKTFKNPLSLTEIKENLFFKDMLLVQRGQKLSIQPVSAKHFNKILKLTE